MRQLSSFMFISLNGFYKDFHNDISWHRHGAEEGAFSAEALQSGNLLLFGRLTYQMMAGFWPTPAALESFPAVARGMNRAEKIVFSRTLNEASWSNTRLVQGDPVAEVRSLKEQPGNNMTLLGSGTVLTQLARAGLVDRYDIMVDPVALGGGTPLFQGLTQPLNLELTASRPFKSGVILLSYRPAT